MFERTHWLDHVMSETGLYNVVKSQKGGANTYTISPYGTVMQQGTYQDSEHFNRIEDILVSHEVAGGMLIAQVLQNRSDIDDLFRDTLAEEGSVTLTNSMAFPFNNSKKTVALKTRRHNAHYAVVAEAGAHTGNIGEIEVSDILANGFKLAYTGSAPSVTIKYKVIGGFQK